MRSGRRGGSFDEERELELVREDWRMRNQERGWVVFAPVDFEDVHMGGLDNSAGILEAIRDCYDLEGCDSDEYYDSNE